MPVESDGWPDSSQEAFNFAVNVVALAEDPKPLFVLDVGPCSIPLHQNSVCRLLELCIAHRPVFPQGDDEMPERWMHPAYK